MKRCGRVLISCIVMFAVALVAPGRCALAEGPDTVLLAAADDPYYVLAQEISRESGLSLYETPAAAVAAAPTYLVWVAAPERLSEAALTAFGRQMDDLGAAVAVGIISGRTVDEARALWGRGQTPDAGADRFAVVNPSKFAGLAAEIIRLTDGVRETMPLTKANLLGTLASTDAVQLSIEGAAGVWYDIGTDLTVEATDIPALPDSVIQFNGCSTFRPWAADSIALACVGQGARAYCGFVYNSVPGTRFGDYGDNDLRYTWAGFSVGQVVQIQNRSAMQAYAVAPHFYMLGDPRIYCGAARPYEVVADHEADGRRIIELAGLPAGQIPVYIPGGAGHDFVQVSGLSGLAADSRHANRDAQMVDIAGDKYLMFDNAAAREQVTITLRDHAPWYWQVLDRVRAVVDWKAINGLGSEMNGYVGLAALLALLIGGARRRYTWRDLGLSLIPGVALTAVWLGYLWAFGDRIALTNVPVAVEWGAVGGVIATTTLGALVFLLARRPVFRLLAVALPNLPSLVMTLVLSLLTAARLWLASGQSGIDRAGYPFTLFLADLVAGLLLYAALFGLWRRIVGRTRPPGETA